MIEDLFKYLGQYPHSLEHICLISLILPLLSSLTVGCLGEIFISRPVYEKISVAAILITTLCGALSFALFMHLGISESTMPIVPFINMSLPKQYKFLDYWTLKLDYISIYMLLVVTIVSSMVHVYSIGYMSYEKSTHRFMSYLSLFTFFMLLLIFAGNPLVMFVGWEGVGMCSYLLIGYWFRKQTANNASYKAFIVNRIGDAAMVIGIICYYYLLNQDTASVFRVFGTNVNGKDLTIWCFMIGAMSKSAQILLHTWLPDAMEGPTPVSALIHAATMVTAGVIGMIRINTWLGIGFSEAIMIIGILTVLFGSFIAVVQTDIKRIIAYSTCSQLGFMFVAIGTSFYNIAFFHLLTHAFFKSLLFLGAGSVIHALDGEQNIMHMGSIRKRTPITFILMLIGCIALSGIYPFAGYYSKDAIIESVYYTTLATSGNVPSIVLYLSIIGTFMTSLYTFRMIFLVFFGNYRGESSIYEKIHESPKVMIIPMIVLAILSITTGVILNNTFNPHFGLSIGGYISTHTENSSQLIAIGPILASLSGILCAYLLYSCNMASFVSRKSGILISFLVQTCQKQLYFDQLYNIVFIRGFKFLSVLASRSEDLGMRFIFSSASFIKLSGWRCSAIRTGYIYYNVLSLLLGVTIAITITLVLIYN